MKQAAMYIYMYPCTGSFLCKKMNLYRRTMINPKMTTTNAEEMEAMIPICRRDRGQEPQSQGQVEHVSSPQHDPSPHTVNKLHYRDIQTIYYKLKLTIQRNMVRSGARLLHDPSPQTVNKPLYREIYTANCKYITTQKYTGYVTVKRKPQIEIKHTVNKSSYGERYNTK